MDLNLSKKQAKDVNDEDLGEVQEVDQNYVLIHVTIDYMDWS
jgi:hypothetical protein